MENMISLIPQQGEDCDPVDITNITIDFSLPREERIRSYLQQIRNPYKFQCNGVTVELAFSENGVSIEDRMAEYICWRQRNDCTSRNMRVNKEVPHDVDQ